MRLSLAAGASSALLVATTVSAFRDSSPLLVWSSQQNDVLADAAAEVNSGVISADTVFGSLAGIGCDWDALVVAHMDELHESHIATMDLPFEGKTADLHIPYLIRPVRESLDGAVQSWATRCGAHVVDSYDASSSGRQIVYVNADHGDLDLPENLPERSLVVLTGTRANLKEQNERGDRVLHTQAADADGSKDRRQDTDDSEPQPPKEEYSYFTEPIISALLVSFGILLPVLFVGLYALAGVQVPPRMMEINKSLGVNKARKEQ